MKWELEEKYIKNDPNLYYDGWLDYGNPHPMEEFFDEIKLYEEIKIVRQSIYSITNFCNELVRTRGRELYEQYDLDDFIYFNDIIMDVYMWKFGIEVYSFEELKQYFIEGSFLDDGEKYLSALKKYRGSLKSRYSLKSRSKGEVLLEDILVKEGYTFYTENSDGCMNPNTMYPLPFDFIVIVGEKKVYIEVQGGQHYRPTNFGNDSKEEVMIKFSRLKERDAIKKEFAKKNGYFVELDYKEGDAKKLKDRIYKNLIPLLEKLGGSNNDNK